MQPLPLKVDDLINGKIVENIRIEYKATLDEHTKPKIIETIAAFANDLYNLNGGYIILGIKAPDGTPILPPIGLEGSKLESIQRDIRIACKKIDPEYQPLYIPEYYQEKHIIVLWIPAGDNRPYRAPNHRKNNEYVPFVRIGPETVKAEGEILKQLLEVTAKIPFDDRRNNNANILAISPTLVKRFLQEIGSGLINIDPPLNDSELYNSLRIVTDCQGVLIPKNIGLIFFNEEPNRFFEGCAFEVVQFADDAGGNLIEEKRFEGPLDDQIRSVLRYLNNLPSVHIRKLPGKAEVEKTIAYPYEALEEAIINAAYHRGYDGINEPNKVYLYPDRMEITSYPGPVPGIEIEDIKEKKIFASCTRKK